jgi:hypothetical protein
MSRVNDARDEAARATSPSVNWFGPEADIKRTLVRRAEAFRHLAVAYQAAPWWRRRHSNDLVAELTAQVVTLSEAFARFAPDGTPEKGEVWRRLLELSQ